MEDTLRRGAIRTKDLGSEKTKKTTTRADGYKILQEEGANTTRPSPKKNKQPHRATEQPTVISSMCGLANCDRRERTGSGQGSCLERSIPNPMDLANIRRARWLKPGHRWVIEWFTFRNFLHL